MVDRIIYIKENFLILKYNLYNPIWSTLFFILIYPTIEIGAFYVSLTFTSWRKKIKNIIERKRLLSVEESIKLMTESQKLEENYIKLSKQKNEEIKKIENSISLLNGEIIDRENKLRNQKLESANKITNLEKIKNKLQTKIDSLE